MRFISKLAFTAIVHKKCKSQSSLLKRVYVPSDFCAYTSSLISPYIKPLSKEKEASSNHGFKKRFPFFASLALEFAFVLELSFELAPV